MAATGGAGDTAATPPPSTARADAWLRPAAGRLSVPGPGRHPPAHSRESPMSLSHAASRAALPVGILMACAVTGAMLAMGLRQSFGLFLAPMTEAHAWTASGFAFAIALQVLLNGVSQPITGQLADRFGGRKVIIGGALLYASGILGMALSDGLPVVTF